MVRELRPEELRRRCDPNLFEFETTADLEPLVEVIGQERAVKSLELGLGIKDHGYNIYVSGSPGTGKNSIVKTFLERMSRNEPTPPDLCYVHNFEDPYTPQYLVLLPGKGAKFERDMKKLIRALKEAIPTAFRSEDYQEQRQRVDEEFNQFRNKLFSQLESKADKKGFIVQRTPIGVRTIPAAGGKPLTEEAFAQLPEKERDRIQKNQQELEEVIQDAIREVQKLEEERNERIEALNEQVAEFTVKPRIARVTEKYGSEKRIVEFLEAVQSDILQHIGDFIKEEAPGQQQQQEPSQAQSGMLDPLKKYAVNVLVSHPTESGAPVVVQDNATYTNLFGKIERRVQYGVMMADFTMIKPGSLHEANGGYLLLSADNLFKYAISWEALKIALRSGKIYIEDPASMMGYTATEGLKPEPIPLEVKVILVGGADIYYLLQEHDEDFKELFNVKADFDDELPWETETLKKFGGFIAARVQERDGLKHFDKAGVARLIEYASEMVEDQKKVSARFSDIVKLVREASYWAEQAEAKFVSAEHVERAISEKIHRHNLVEEKIREMIARGDLFIDVTGERVGQVNGLSVLMLGDFSFGRPTRITANIFTGKEGVLDIEREADLSGKIHTKGMMILKGWLGERFALDKPLSLSASLAFEQSYSPIDGDSASSTELYVLLSALANVPIKQNIAVTGSVNQKGEVQPIGGANEKIEGFYRVCKVKGLTGDQGVMIPAQNIDNLTLHTEVVEAVTDGKFHIWAVQTIEEGIEFLTGLRAGRRLADGTFEAGTLFHKVDQKLREIQEHLSEEENDDE
ncbi:AAA family ATPase [Candidatus Acetothermia bacterium]|nr:AAA family ATPase [Candidatus Acetothermia bacterium]MBI3659327.1 AAA family ATPase [Candidatus Acetothermia bacterium]